MNTEFNLDQKQRLGIIVVYWIILLGLSYWLFGEFIPSGSKNIWLLSGLAGILFGTRLISPYFTPPADAISYAFTALVVFLSTGFSAPTNSDLIAVLWGGSLVYLGLTLIIGMLSILIKDHEKGTIGAISELSFKTNKWLGHPTLIFTILVFYSVIAFHIKNPVEAASITFAWIVLALFQPLEFVADSFMKYRDEFTERKNSKIGSVIRHETPNIVLINDDGNKKVTPNDLLIARTEDGELGVAMAIDHVGYIDGRWLRAVHFGIPHSWIEDELESLESIKQNEVYDIEIAPNLSRKIDDQGFHLFERKNEMIGVVSENSSLSNLKIDVVPSQIDLQEGMLVETEIQGEKVLYQITKGVTKDEIIEKKNKRGHVIAEANKIGTWNEDNLGFDKKAWLPKPNKPVFISKESDESFEDEEHLPLGKFPDSSYPVYIESIDELVTHNTAILGILGVGKTFLALELIERMIDQNIKVICLDITGEYKEELEPYRCSDLENKIIEILNRIGEAGEEEYDRNEEEGGSWQEFKNELRRILEKFFNSEDSNLNLLIFDPSKLNVWEQTSGIYQGEAAMSTLTVAEITRIFSEVVLEILQEEGKTDEARCCMIYEEAHSLIPEFRSTANEGDSQASSGTAKSIMQGRKYGLGCIVITQRTANVTKSILNQCNTIFSMRVYDATGMDFLENYIGEEQVDSLSELEDRQAIVFGRGSSCDDPIITRLNDRQDFLDSFRTPPDLNCDDLIDDWFNENEEGSNEDELLDDLGDFSAEDPEDDIPF